MRDKLGPGAGASVSSPSVSPDHNAPWTPPLWSETMEQARICTKCHEQRPISWFYFRKDRPGKRKSHCKACRQLDENLRRAALRKESPSSKRPPVLPTCPQCGVRKAPADFILDGRRRSTCAACLLKSKADRLQRGHQRSSRQKFLSAVYARQYAKKHPIKTHCRNTSNRAQAKGNLLPRPCAVCGCAEVQKHHADYSRPLDITWLCDRHHRQVHASKSVS